MSKSILLMFPTFIFISIFIPREYLSEMRTMLVVWDTQTGVIIKGVDTQGYGRVMFHGDQRTITLVPFGQPFYVYDALSGTLLCQDKILPPGNHQLGAHWIHEDALLFSTNLKTNGKAVTNIYKLQPTSTPPLHMLSSSPIPFHDGLFSFSPVSTHASFVNKQEVVILNIQDSKLLLQAEVDQVSFPVGCFSFDGHFFTCGVLTGKVNVWQNTPTGYVLWASLRSRLPFEGFSWSPTSTLILCWGLEGIQLLHPDNCFSPLSPEEVNSTSQNEHHMVAYSADGTHIATTQQQTSVVTVLNCPSSTSWDLTTDMKIEDIRIFDDVIFMVDANTLISWHLKADKVVNSNQTLDIDYPASQLTLSHDCSQIAFSLLGKIFLYDVKTQKTITKDIGHCVDGIRFSTDGPQLWYVTEDDGLSFVGLKIAEGWSSLIETERSLEDGRLLFNLCSPLGYDVGIGSEWIVDSKGSKLFWLPPNWRISQQWDIRWDSNFLAFIGPEYQKPMIIEFQL